MPIGTRVASGNITPSSFVTLTSTNGKVALSGTGDQPWGISQEGTRNAPYGALDDGFCAIAGESLRIYIAPEVNVMLQVSATVSPGNKLKPDSSGLGTPITTDGDYYGAIAMGSGNSGDLVPVQLVSGAQQAS